jgi:hypothetical protein
MDDTIWPGWRNNLRPDGYAEHRSYQGVLRHSSEVRWACPHKHTGTKEAVACAEEHKRLSLRIPTGSSASGRS